ncbi:MAG: hypothetical protein GTN36_02850, partial [Candidatus Aenigmarchaeota archaeon]|nr:hypothetical protein [Candidatus Aenigmarchaeota archaeon]
KGYSGQSQLLIPLVIILTSVVAFAANTTIEMINSTSNDSNSSITGSFIGIPQTTEKSFPIEVWADTSINLELGENLVRATLILDNGDLLEDQQMDFYLNNTLLGSGLTNSEGFVDFPVSDKGIIKAVFNGDQYLNPSESEINKYCNNCGQEETQKIAKSEAEIRFYRRLDCNKCGQHKAPPLTEVNMSIWVSNKTGDLIDYYPIEWTITNANSGLMNDYNETHKKIEFDKPSAWYMIKSPQRKTPSTKYYFFSEFNGVESDLWQVIVSDPDEYDCIIGGTQYKCQDFSDDVDISDSSADESYINIVNWTTGNSCPGAAEVCFLHNISVRAKAERLASGSWCNIFEIRNSEAANATSEGFSESTSYDFWLVNSPDESSTGWRIMCDFSNDTVGTTSPPQCDSPAFGSRNSTKQQGTCDLNSTDKFNVTNTTDKTGTFQLWSGIEALGGGGTPSSTNMIRIDYTWAWSIEEPALSNESVIPSTGGWGEDFNFTVNVTDPNTYNVSVYAWHSIYPSGPWEQIGNQINISGCNVSYPCNVTITYSDYVCGNQTATMYYFFNVSNNNSYVANTSVHYFAIEKDDINVDNVSSSWNETINRSEAFNFTLNISDRDNQSAPHYL